VLCSIGLDVRIRLPRTNRSRHPHYARYYTPSVEEVVYEKYRWAFEAGGYERMSFDSDRLLQLGARAERWSQPLRRWRQKVDRTSN
jgi:hypothetical protein